MTAADRETRLSQTDPFETAEQARRERGGILARWLLGRIGSRPFTRAEMERLFLNRRGVPWKVQDTGTMTDWVN